MSKVEKKDYSEIKLYIDGEFVTFKRGFIPGDVAEKAFEFKALYEREIKAATIRIKKENPKISEEELGSELINVLVMEFKYFKKVSELVSFLFGGQFTPEQYISGTNAREIFSSSQEYVYSAIQALMPDSEEEEEVENLSEEK